MKWPHLVASSSNGFPSNPDTLIFFLQTNTLQVYRSTNLKKIDVVFLIYLWLPDRCLFSGECLTSCNVAQYTTQVQFPICLIMLAKAGGNYSAVATGGSPIPDPL